MNNNYSQSYNSIFLKKYKELEKLETNEPNKYNYLLKKHRNEMDTFRYMRNTLAHNLINGYDPFIVSSSVVDLIGEYLEKVSKKVIDIAVKQKDMIVVSYFNTLKDALLLMGNNNYSYLPIVDSSNKVLGIVSSDTVIDLLNKKDELDVNEKDELNKYANYFSLSNKTNGIFLFIKKDMDVYELNNLVDVYEHTTHKCNLILLTSTGDKNGRLVGLLTPWDLLKNS